MPNSFQIPDEVERRLRREFKKCAYCGRRMKAYLGVKGCPGDKATIEHLNWRGPFKWSEGLEEKHLVMVCGRCNSSRGLKKLSEWFKSAYCLEHKISGDKVASRVQEYLRTRDSTK